MNKHTQKLFAFVILACSGAFLVANSALAFTITGGQPSYPVGYSGSLGSLTITQQEIIDGSGNIAGVENLQIYSSCFDGGLDGNLGLIGQYFCPSGIGSCGGIGDIQIPLSLLVTDNGLLTPNTPETCTSAETTYSTAIIYGDGAMGGSFVPLPTTYTIQAVSTTTGNAILDTLMPKVVVTFTDFLTQIFRDFWPFFLVFAIVAGFAKAVQKLLSIMTK